MKPQYMLNIGPDLAHWQHICRGPFNKLKDAEEAREVAIRHGTSPAWGWAIIRMDDQPYAPGPRTISKCCTLPGWRETVGKWCRTLTARAMRPL